MAREPLPRIEEVLSDQSSSGPSRRALLSAMGVGGASLLAGCFGDDDGESGNDAGDIDPSELDHVDGQNLRFSTAQDPAEMTFLNTRAFPPTAIIGDVDWVVPGFHAGMMMERGMWGMWSNMGIQSGDAHLLQFENIDITSDEITVDIRDDAVWSDGEPVRGQDFITELAIFRMFDNITPVDQVLEQGERGSLQVSSITDFEYDDSSFTLISEGDFFDSVIEQDIWSHLLTGWVEWGGLNYPTHAEPYDGYTDIVWDRWDQYLSGEWQHPMNGGDTSIRNPLMEYIGMDSNDVPEMMRDPDNVVTNGAWTLGEIRGSQEIVLEPNEHHRNADLINFDNVIISYREDDRGNWAALQSNQLDYFGGSMPEDVMSSLPDNFETRSKPTDSGVGLALDHSSELFEDVRARQALMYLIDTEQLVQVEGESTGEPVMTPGGDVNEIEPLVGENFADENLRTYGHDPGAAEDLLEQAGWSKSGGTWSMPSGETASVTFPTTAETPRWEQNLVDQLSDFGFEANLRIYDNAVYADELHALNFDMWADGRQEFVPGLGYPNWGLSRVWSHLPAQWAWTQMTNIFPDEQVEQTEYGPYIGGYSHEYGLIADTSTEDSGFGGFTIEIPEVGDFEGSTSEVEICARAWEAHRPDSEGVLQENYPIMAWATNYYLPGIPLFHDNATMALNTGNWYWPAEDTTEWEPAGIDTVQPETLVGHGDKVFANPDNPRSE